MREAKVVVRVIQRQLLVYAVFAFAQRRDAPSHGSDMLADRQVKTLHKRGGGLPAAGRQDWVDAIECPEHHPGLDIDHTPPAYRLHHLGIEQPRPGYPAGRWCFK